MTLKPGLLAIAILMTGAWGAYLLFPDGPGHEHGLGSHHHVSEDESELRGPNNGRLFRDGDFELELTIFERGTPPEFRAWCRFAGRPVAPAEVQLAVRLERPGAKSDQHRFLPAGGYLRSPDEVYEPHSFTYHVTATYAGKERRWVRAAPDMQTTIAAAVAEASGVRVQRAAPAPIVELVSALGFIRPADGRSAAVSPRFAGVLREMRKTVGDRVSAGEVLAVVETNLTLASVDLKSPLTGVVVARTAVPGQTVAEGEALLQVADLSEVWAELWVSCGQIGRVAPGSRVTLRSAHGADSVESEVVWIAPVADPLSQSVAVRAVLRGVEGRWRPGLAVRGEIVVGTLNASVAVRESALQQLHGFDVVFSRHGELYQARPLELGRRAGGWVEVLKGLAPGEEYVTDNSFLIKADIGKSGASHDH